MVLHLPTFWTASLNMSQPAPSDFPPQTCLLCPKKWQLKNTVKQPSVSMGQRHGTSFHCIFDRQPLQTFLKHSSKHTSTHLLLTDLLDFLKYCQYFNYFNGSFWLCWLCPRCASLLLLCYCYCFLLFAAVLLLLCYCNCFMPSVFCSYLMFYSLNSFYSVKHFELHSMYERCYTNKVYYYY